ncbi:hypothetical protein AGLY_012821 [Aphis glycines]|uniref:Uncharacterized protein n=1 Tax=Aphis glycines TaxID=307491 RepID=A0A6G0T879_APHGL|nr:hypothetical protein AGLY_012821 [Aphis glycines]
MTIRLHRRTRLCVYQPSATAGCSSAMKPLASDNPCMYVLYAEFARCLCSASSVGSLTRVSACCRFVALGDCQLSHMIFKGGGVNDPGLAILTYFVLCDAGPIPAQFIAATLNITSCPVTKFMTSVTEVSVTSITSGTPGSPGTSKIHTLFDFIRTLPLINHSTEGNVDDVNVTFTFRSSPFFKRYSFGRLFIFGAVQIYSASSSVVDSLITLPDLNRYLSHFTGTSGLESSTYLRRLILLYKFVHELDIHKLQYQFL